MIQYHVLANALKMLHFIDLMIEMEDQTNDINEARIPVLDYKTYTDRVFFLPSKDGEKDVMITGKLDIPEARKATVEQALNQFSNLLNSKSFLINVSRKLSHLSCSREVLLSEMYLQQKQSFIGGKSYSLASLKTSS